MLGNIGTSQKQSLIYLRGFLVFRVSEEHIKYEAKEI